MGDPTTLNYVTLAIAGWGAALSTLLAVRQIRRDRRRVHVKVTLLIFMTDKKDGDGWVDRQLLRVDAINDGTRPVEIVRHGVYTIGGSHFIPMPIDPETGERANPLPKHLQDGERVTIDYDRSSSFEDDHRAVGVFVEDSQGRTYRSRAPGLANIVRMPLSRARWTLETRVRLAVREWRRRRAAKD